MIEHSKRRRFKRHAHHGRQVRDEVGVEIAQVIVKSVFAHPEAIPLTQAQKHELERRWRAFEQNPDEGESWDDVKHSLLSE